MSHTHHLRIFADRSVSDSATTRGQYMRRCRHMSGGGLKTCRTQTPFSEILSHMPLRFPTVCLPERPGDHARQAGRQFAFPADRHCVLP